MMRCLCQSLDTRMKAIHNCRRGAAGWRRAVHGGRARADVYAIT